MFFGGKDGTADNDRGQLGGMRNIWGTNGDGMSDFLLFLLKNTGLHIYKATTELENGMLLDEANIVSEPKRPVRPSPGPDWTDGST